MEVQKKRRYGRQNWVILALTKCAAVTESGFSEFGGVSMKNKKRKLFYSCF
jgi:hypothetical protein